MTTKGRKAVKQWGLIALICVLNVFVVSTQGSGGYIAYVAAGPVNNDIFVADLATGQVRNLTNNQVQSAHPTWSGDGAAIAFNNVLDGGNVDIFVMAANGINARNISNHPAVDVSPDWSPVSDAIAFMSNRDGGFDLYTVNAQTGSTERLTMDGADKNRPAWSPDGNRIAYWQVMGDDIALMIYDLPSARASALVTEGENLWPAWSPDGRTIAVHSTENGTAQIYLINAEDGTRLQITDDEANNFRPAFSPDGRRIAFISDRNGDNDLFTMAIDGTDIQPLIVNAGDDVSPDWRAASPQIDFDANPNLGQSAVRVEGSEVASNEALGAGSYRVFAPPEANYEDYIRVRLEIALDDVDSIPGSELPIRDEGDITVYRYMGAEITGFDLDDFEIFPTPSAYLLEIQTDDVNYWEWYLRPNGADVLGNKLLFIEIYLPDVDDDGVVTSEMLKRIPLSISLVGDEPDAESTIVEADANVTVEYDAAYLQDDVNPQEDPLGFSVYLNSENLLAISFSESLDVAEMSVASGAADYAIVQLFPDVTALYDAVIPASYCIFYERDGTTDALPLACQTENRLSRTLNAGDIFWYSSLSRGLQDVIIRLNGKTYVCSPVFDRCDF